MDAESSKQALVAQPAATKQSTRGKRKHHSVADDATQASAKVEQPDPPKKRVRRQPVKGRLSGLLEMPMDVLFEIFGHLRPVDLLHLSRTTKEFRRLLMHRSSISVWKSARENVLELPDCPASFSEPAYANLVFGTHCYVCLNPYIRTIDWRLGKRLCSKCSKSSLGRVYIFGAGATANNLTPRTFSKRSGMVQFKAERDAIDKRLKELSGDDKKEEYDAFVAHRSAYIKDLEQLAPKLERWALVRANNRSEELDEARRDRKQAIIDKLTELGWGSEIESIPSRDDLSHHKLIKQPTRLTPRIWSNIKDEMIRYMEEMKTNRLARERAALVMLRKRHAITILREYKVARIPFVDVMPEAPDFCAFPEVNAILQLPNEVEVTPASFGDVISNMDTLSARWRAEILKKLVDAIAKKTLALRSPSEDMDVDSPHPLHLATTVFRCEECHGPPTYGDYDSDEDEHMLFGMFYGPRRCQPMFYPQVMGHQCLTRRMCYWDEFSNDPSEHLRDCVNTSRTKWNMGPLLLDDQASSTVRSIVALCGKDPRTTTLAQLDELDPRLACLGCLDWSDEEEDQADAKVFRWRQAVQHQISGEHSGRQRLRWKLLEGDELQAYQEIEAQASASSSSDTTLSAFQRGLSIWKCVSCLDLTTENTYTHSAVRSHLSHCHQITEPELNRDYMQMYGSDASGTELPDVTLTLERPPDVFSPGEKADYLALGMGASFLDWYFGM